MKKVFLSMVAIILLAGCSSGEKRLETTDSRECTQNFTYNGSFLSGRTYKTNATVKNISKKVAMDRVARLIAKDGWQIISNNNQAGTISASQTVSYGNGKTVPLNIIFEQVNKNTVIDISYSTSGGVTSPLDAVVDQFCSIVASASKK